MRRTDNDAVYLLLIHHGVRIRRSCGLALFRKWIRPFAETDMTLVERCVQGALKGYHHSTFTVPVLMLISIPKEYLPRNLAMCRVRSSERVISNTACQAQTEE
jgi:hypothetical protein